MRTRTWGLAPVVALLLTTAGFSGACSETPADVEGAGGTSKTLLSSQKKVIGSLGGELEVDGTKLLIPPGALAEDVEIQMGKLGVEAASKLPGMPGAVSSAGAPWAFTPHGITFSVPVTIEMNHSGQVGALAVAKLLDEDDLDWERAGSDWQFDNGKASFAVTAFSIYNIVDDPEGTLDADVAPPAEPGEPAEPTELGCMSGGTLFATSVVADCAMPELVDLTTINPGDIAFIDSATSGSPGTAGQGCTAGAARVDAYQVTVVEGDELSVSVEGTAGVDMAVSITEPDPAGDSCASTNEVTCASAEPAGSCEYTSARSGGTDYPGDTVMVLVTTSNADSTYKLFLHRL